MSNAEILKSLKLKKMNKIIDMIVEHGHGHWHS